MTDRILTVAGSVLALMIAAAALFGMGTCIQYERQRERECMARGGTIVSVSRGVACARLVPVDSTGRVAP